MSAEVWGVVAAFAGVGAAFLAVFVTAFFWLLSAIQKLGQEIRTELREERRAQQAENQEERKRRDAEIQEERKRRDAEIQEERKRRDVEIQEERRRRESEIQEDRRQREAEIQEERRQRDEERRERQAESQRLFDSLYRHRHDASDSMYVPADDD